MQLLQISYLFPGRIAQFKRIAHHALFETANDLFDMAAKHPLERTTWDEYLLFAFAESQHGRHIWAAHAGMAGFHQEPSRRGNAQGAKCFVDDFFQHVIDSSATQKCR